MLRRKIEQFLTEWKNTENHKPLIIKGCRQCGKTFSVLDFAKKNYKNVVYLNFFENPDYASVFADSLEIDNIVMMLSALLGIPKRIRYYPLLSGIIPYLPHLQNVL